MSSRSAGGWRRWWRTGGALLVLVAAVEYGVVPRVVGSLSRLTLVADQHWWSTVGAVLLEATSLALYTGLTQVLVGERRLAYGVQLRIDLAGYGLGHVLPGGGAASAGMRVQWMVDRGVPVQLALSLTAVQAVFAVLGLLVVWALGALLSLPRTGDVLTAGVLVLALAGALVGMRALSGSGRAAPADLRPRVRRRLGSLVSRVPPRWRRAAVTETARVRRSLRDTEAVGRALSLSAGNWLLDALCLWLCLEGYGAGVAPELVLVSYGLALTLGSIPLTPGGLGVVEGLLVPGLVAAGAPAGAALLGVVTWRILQFWVPIPVALVCWLSLGGRAGRVPLAGRRPGRDGGPSQV